MTDEEINEMRAGLARISAWFGGTARRQAFEMIRRPITDTILYSGPPAGLALLLLHQVDAFYVVIAACAFYALPLKTARWIARYTKTGQE